MKRFLALTGPTASGKTALSLRVARRLDGEIVSMDSRQVYRGMDVGTAKATAAERALAPHHGLDLLDPDEAYSAGRFARDARRWIRQIRGRGRLPLLVGGTGFFLRAVLEPVFREPDLDPERVERLREHFDDESSEELKRWLEVLDPERAEVAAEGGPQRMTRTLEVALLSGRPLSWWHREAPLDGEAVDGLVVCLELPREELDRRIRRRTEAMLEGGLVSEVRSLLEAGFDSDDPGMTGTGYRETVSHIRGEMTLSEVRERIFVATRQYSRRQLTWFRNQLPDDAVRIDATRPLEVQAGRVEDAWRSACTGGGEEGT